MRSLSFCLIIGFIFMIFADPFDSFAQNRDHLKRFTLLHTNDEHAAFLPKPFSEYGLPGERTSGGIARLATIIREVRAAKRALGEEVLVLNAGDFISGSPFSWLVLENEAPEISLMIAAGYDVVTLGNHEFDYGPERLASYFEVAGYPEMSAKTPVLASNSIIPDGHPLGEVGLKDTYIRTLENGLKIGFFGIIGQHAVEVAPMAEPVTFAGQHETARRAVGELLEAGADVIVMLSHSGEGEETVLANAVPGIDVIIGGHTHKVIPQPIIAGKTIIVQTGTEFEYIGKLEFEYDPLGGTLKMLNMPDEDSDETYLIIVDETTAEDPIVAALVDEYGAQLSVLVAEMTYNKVPTFDKVIARSDVTLSRMPENSETPFGNFITDAMRFAAERATGERVDVVFEASGVIRGDLVPGKHPDNLGAITFYDLASLIGLGSGPDSLPGYPMVSVYFTGEELRRTLEITVLLSELRGSTYYLQNSGLLVDYDPARMLWLRVPFLGTPIPSSRSVLRASLYSGDGRQTRDLSDYTPLHWNDETLYHVVSDYYNASFLPMVGDVLPSLALVMKDKQGNPVELEDRIIYTDGNELKVWQAVTEYVMNQPPGEDMVPVVDATYANVEGRMQKVEGPWLLFWPITAGGISVIVLIYGIMHLRKRRKQHV